MTARADRAVDVLDDADEVRDTIPTAQGRGSASSWKWFLSTLLATLIASLVPLYFAHEFYFVNDTQSGAFGIWYRLGVEVRSGHIQIFNPHAWMAGNYVAEGQWGFLSPVVLLVGLLASFSGNALVFSTVVKIVFMMIAAGGVFCLARSFGADQRWAMVAGVAAPLSGFAMYMDEPAWVTGLMIWALLPWFWTALRRTVYSGRNPALALVMAYLVISIGYVYGAIGVVFILVGVIAERAVRRQWLGVRRSLLVGVLSGLVTITVYLPGVLTANVTWRQTGISNDGFMQPGLTGLATSSQPTAIPAVRGFWAGLYPHAPLMYIAWFLPLLVLIDWRKFARRSRLLVDGWITLALFAMMLFAPAQIGPLRFPVRTMGSFVVVLLPIVACLLSVARAPRTRGRLYALGGVILTIAYLAFAQKPAVSHSLLAAAVVSALGCWLVWRSAPAAEETAAAEASDVKASDVRAAPTTRLSGKLWYDPSGRLPAGVAAVMVAITIGFVGLQHHSFKVSPLDNYHVPTSISAYKAVQRPVDDAIIIGGLRIGQQDPALWREFAIANTWYISGEDRIQNVYTTIGFAKYSALTCINYLGSSCPALLTRLFTYRDATSLLLVDELSLNSVRIIKSFVPVSTWSTPYPGWRITDNGPLTVTWVREHPVAGAGVPVQHSPGMQISDVHSSDRTVSFRVDALPSGGGGVTFSRLHWPGYSASNATIGDDVDGFLLHVNVPASSLGKVVTVTFEPPGWKLEWAAWGVALLAGLIWSVLFEVRRRRTGVAAS